VRSAAGRARAAATGDNRSSLFPIVFTNLTADIFKLKFVLPYLRRLFFCIGVITEGDVSPAMRRPNIPPQVFTILNHGQAQISLAKRIDGTLWNAISLGGSYSQ
jgi:hypothetical protein